MALIASRLSDTGTYYIAGEFDEVSQTAIRLTADNQYAAFFDEVTMHVDTVTFTPTPAYSEEAVFQDTGNSDPNLRWRFGAGISYPRELNGYIYSGNVALGTKVYVKWQYSITLDGGATWVNQEAYLGSVVGFDGMGSADTAYLYVSNPLGIAWRPSSGGTFIPGNIVAYNYTYVRFEPASVAKRETSTGTLLVSGYFDEVTDINPPNILASAAYNSEGWVSESTDYVGTTGNFTYSYLGALAGQANTGGARSTALPYDGTSKYYAEVLVTAIDTTSRANPYDQNLTFIVMGLSRDDSSGGYNNANGGIYLVNGWGLGSYTGYNIPSRPDPQPNYSSNNPDRVINGDTLMFAYDSSANKVYYGRNGQWAIDPSSGNGIAINGDTSSNLRITFYSGASLPVTWSGRFVRKANLAYPIPSGYVSAST